MRGRSLSILGIFAAAIGAILILCFNSIKVTGVTISGGILLVGVGLINLLFYSGIVKGENPVGRVLTLVANAAATVLGVSMLVFQSTFGPMIAFMFGLFVAVCALWQFFVLAVGTRPYQLPAWLYLFPIAIAGASAYIFIDCQGPGADHLLMLATGGSLALLGIGCVIEGSVLGAARRASRHKDGAPATEGGIDDVTPTQPTTTEVAPIKGADDKPQKPKIETTDDLDDEIITPGSSE